MLFFLGGMDGLSWVPPPRFAMVQKQLYRGAYPTLRHMTFLCSLELKSILCLSPEAPTGDLREFCRAQKILLKHIAVDRYKEGETPLLSQDATAVLEFVLNGNNYPCLMCCLDGRHIIGCVTMLVRRVEMWSPTAAAAEFSRFSGQTPVPAELLASVNDFSAPINLSACIPSWLWGGKLVDREGRPQRHPTLRLRNPAATSAPPRSAPQDGTLVVKLVGAVEGNRRVDTSSDFVELGGELRMLGCADTSTDAASAAGLNVQKSTGKHTDRRVESKMRSASAEPRSGQR